MIEQHGKTWRYDYQVGRVRYKRGGYLTEEDAKLAEAQSRTNITVINVEFEKLKVSRLKELKNNRTGKHHRENELFLEEVEKILGTKNKISYEDVQGYLEGVSKESHTLANRKLKLLKALFNHGIKKRFFYHNPCTGIEKYSVGKKKKRYIPSKEDIQKVLETASLEQRRYLLIIIHTIARVREINKLKWEDVNFEKRYVTLTTRKSRNSDEVTRDISMNDTLYWALSTAPKNGSYVFMNKRTKKDFDYRDKLLTRLCEKAGVRRFTYHCLRHYGASKLAEANIGLATIQEVLGHSKASTTSIYLQSLGGKSIEAMKVLE